MERIETEEIWKHRIDNNVPSTNCLTAISKFCNDRGLGAFNISIGRGNANMENISSSLFPRRLLGQRLIENPN